MARKVYDNDMVAHVWAQQNQDEGRSSNGNFYFVGPVLFSYGSHYVVGVFDNEGRAWLNADSSSMTTSGKHKPAARRAVRRAFTIPSLTGIYRAIQDMHDKSRAEWVKREISAYLDSNWAAFPADSEAGAILWAAVSRGAWAKERTRREAKAAKASATNARNAKRHAIAHAKEVAAIPLDMVRVRMIERLSSASDYAREGAARDMVRYYQDAHKGSQPGKVRVALWERVKLAKEIAARLTRHSKGHRAKERAAIARLRRIWAGDYGQATPLSLALAEREALNEASPAPMGATLRKRLESRLADVQGGLAALEEAAAAARYAEQEENRANWMAGISRYGRDLCCPRGGPLLRAVAVEMDGCRVVGGTLETSQGASVPLAHAVRAFAFVRAVRARGERWESAPCVVSEGFPSRVRVGHFNLDSVESNGDFRAGCHDIKWNEVERLARSLGLWDCDDSAMALAGNEEEAA